MDSYFTNLARHALSKADAEIVASQDFLVAASAVSSILVDTAEVLQTIRRLQDSLHDASVDEMLSG